MYNDKNVFIYHILTQNFLLRPQTAMELVFVAISVFLNLNLVTGQCIINPDGAGNWPQWPPIITNQVGDLILPTGVEDNRQITIESDQVYTLLSCTIINL